MASKSSSKADDLQLPEKAKSSIGADDIAVEDKCFIYDTNDLHFQYINWPPESASFTQSKVGISSSFSNHIYFSCIYFQIFKCS